MCVNHTLVHVCTAIAECRNHTLVYVCTDFAERLRCVNHTFFFFLFYRLREVPYVRKSYLGSCLYCILGVP